MILMNTAATRRLVNCRTLVRQTYSWGSQLEQTGGADGIPERALDMARGRAAHNDITQRAHGYKVVGIGITDVITGEKWAVAL